MHPVLIYSALFIIIIVGLLFAFERYQFGSVYFLLFIASISTYLLGKLLVKLFPSEDPMQEEILREKKRVYANQYKHEIQFLFNIVQPDPKLQPAPKRISDSLKACFELDDEVMQARLEQYFGDSFNISTHQPLADMIEQIKSEYKDWPPS